MATLPRLDGSLTIGGTITSFPNFAALEVIEGNLTIESIITGLGSPVLTALNDIFPSLNWVQGNIRIHDNEFVETISGFAELDSVGGDLDIGVFTGLVGSPEASNAALTSIPTFSALKKVGRSLTCTSNILLTSIPSFSALESTGRGINIAFNTELKTISGFGALTTVGRDILIGGNVTLRSIAGFGALKSIGRKLLITNNDVLVSVSGFDVLGTISENFEIGSLRINPSGNPLLTTLPSFDALTNIEGNLNITVNSSLTTLPTFSTLATIGDSLLLARNLALTSISGFGELTSIGTAFIIDDHLALETVSGFGKLNSIGNDFTITDNPSLTTISDFGALTTITGDLTIEDNALLASCCGLIRIADDTVTPGGTTTISGNAAGCNNKAEITDRLYNTHFGYRWRITINDDTDVPSRRDQITRITGNLTIGGTITTFPDFAALEGRGGQSRD